MKFLYHSTRLLACAFIGLAVADVFKYNDHTALTEVILAVALIACFRMDQPK